MQAHSAQDRASAARAPCSRPNWRFGPFGAGEETVSPPAQNVRKHGASHLVAAAPARLTRPNGPFINGLRTSRKSHQTNKRKRGRKPIPASAFIQTAETRPAPHKHNIKMRGAILLTHSAVVFAYRRCSTASHATPPALSPFPRFLSASAPTIASYGVVSSRNHRITEDYGRSSSHGMLVRLTRGELLSQ